MARWELPRAEHANGADRDEPTEGAGERTPTTTV